MQLHQVFADSDDAPPPTKAVKIRVLSPTKNGPPRTISAVLALVDEPESAAAIRDAEISLQMEYKGDAQSGPLPIPPGTRGSEQIYHFLFRSLRTEADPRKPLARTVLELKKALLPAVAGRLHAAYQAWVDVEFPDTITEKAFNKAEEDAAEK